MKLISTVINTEFKTSPIEELEDFIKTAKEQGATHYDLTYRDHDYARIDFKRDEDYANGKLATYRDADTPEDIARHLNFLNDNQALVCIFDGTIGIATENESGYNKAYIRLKTANYNEVSKMVDAANVLLFPDRDPLKTMQIVASSMR